MTTPHEETTDESFDETSGDWAGFGRRPILKALGAGVSLSVGSGVALAQEGDGEAANDDGEAPDDDGAIDPHYGYATPEAANVPEELAPDHEIQLHTQEPADPANPDRPTIFFFEPSALHVQSGDVVQFTMGSPDHTITAYHPAMGFQQRVPDGVPPFSSPVLNVGGAWLYQFDTEGLYDVYCGPHHILGMTMRIVVGDLTEADVPDYEDTFEGSQDPPLLAPFSKEFLEHELNAPNEANEDCEWPWLTPQEVLDAAALDPANIQSEGKVPFDDVLAEIDRFPDELPEHDEADEADDAAPTVQVYDHDEHNSILVGPDGMTLYMFDQDAQGAGESACSGGCAEAWPALTVETDASAGEGVEAELSTFEREDGSTQVAANGWPLYYFAQDEQPGDANGQGVNEVWWVLQPDGTPIRPE